MYSGTLDLSHILVTESDDSDSDFQSRSQPPEPQSGQETETRELPNIRQSLAVPVSAKEFPFITSVPRHL